MTRSTDQRARGFPRELEPLLRRSAAYAYAIVRHREDAEDAVQEAAIKGLRAFPRYDPSRPFLGWWLTILRNCCRDLLRRRQCRPSAVTPDRVDLVPQTSACVRQDDDLRAAMDRLSDAHREILELRYFGGCSYREIASVLGIPEGTVMSRLHAARQALAGMYRKEEHHEAR
jgi:RNA polymerase sigma-70 factor (ECF subfamily)